MAGVSLPTNFPTPLRLVGESEDLGLLRSHLKGHYRSLSPGSRRLRFMGDSSTEVLDRLADRADPELLLEIVEDGLVRAVLEAYATSPGHVEVAVSVEDAYQGQGLGNALLEEGLTVLASRGFQTADLFCLRQNMILLRLVSRGGARVRFNEGEIHIEIELDRWLERRRPLDPRPLSPAA